MKTCSSCDWCCDEHCHKGRPVVLPTTRNISRDFESFATVVSGKPITVWPKVNPQEDYCGEHSKNE